MTSLDRRILCVLAVIVIVESNAGTIADISSPGDIKHVVEHIHEGHFSQMLEPHHVKTFQLPRFIAASHLSVDGNRRAALISTRISYTLNGCRFDYDWEIKEILRALVADESSVETDDVIAYLRAHTESFVPEYEATISLWLARIEGTDQLLTEYDTVEQDTHGPDNYDDDAYSGE